MFRKATAGHCRSVYDLICNMEAKELPYDDFASIFHEQLAADCYHCLIWEENGEVTGMLNLRFERQLHHCASIAEILEFVVDPAYRSQGLGAAMFAEACRIARESGCAQIEVTCNQLRNGAHRFYERRGMKNHHYKFSLLLEGCDGGENVLGR